jgi:large-conductance mechanosensitive channel
MNINSNHDVRISSNRSFAIVFFVVFLLIALYPITYSGDIRIWSLMISFIFIFLGLLNSKILTPLNKIWFKFGNFLGKIVSPLIMGVIFFFVVTPIGLIMRMLGKDVLNLKKNKNKSYWIKKSGPKSRMKNQF